MASWSRKRVFHFIELYRSYECLWKVKSMSYNNRELKDRAYEHLVRSVREFDSEADRLSVVKKINNLRSSFRKELNKVKISKLSGAASDEAYVPKLWYFEHLMFLKDQDVPREQIAGQSIEIDFSEDVALKTEPLLSSPKNEEEDSCPVLFDAESAADPGSPCSTSSTAGRLSSPQTAAAAAAASTLTQDGWDTRLKTKRKRIDEVTLSPPSHKLNCSSCPEDRHDVFGKFVTYKLRAMSRAQRLHAEKIISDVMYEGELGNLSRSARLDLHVSTVQEVQHASSGEFNEFGASTDL